MAITSQTLLERAKYTIGVAAQDVGTANVTGDYQPVVGFNRVAAVAVSEVLTLNDTVTIQLKQADDASGTNAADLGDSVTVTAGGAEAVIAEVEESVQYMAADKTHVAVELSASADGTDASAVLVFGDAAYRP